MNQEDEQWPQNILGENWRKIVMRETKSGWKTSLKDYLPSSLLGLSATEPTISEATTGHLYQHRMTMDYDECGAVGGMLSRGNRSTRRKPAPLPLYPPQIPHDLTRARTRAAAVESRWLTIWATARPRTFLQRQSDVVNWIELDEDGWGGLLYSREWTFGFR
jgi:hypothetical protein